MRTSSVRVRSEDGESLDLDQRLDVPEPGDADAGHGRVVACRPAAATPRRSRGRGRGSRPCRRCRWSATPAGRGCRRPRRARSAGWPAPARTAPPPRRRRSRRRASIPVWPARKTDVPRPDHGVGEARRAGQGLRVDPLHLSHHDCTAPPSTLIPCPVTAPLSTQSITADATSSTVTRRPIGCRLRQDLPRLVLGPTGAGRRCWRPTGRSSGCRRSPGRRRSRSPRCAPPRRRRCGPARARRACWRCTPRSGRLPILPATDAITTTRPYPPSRHRRQGPTQAAERRGQVEVEHPLPVLVGGAHQRRRHRRPGVDDQDLDRPPLALDRAKASSIAAGIGDVGRKDESGPGNRPRSRPARRRCGR